MRERGMRSELFEHLPLLAELERSARRDSYQCPVCLGLDAPLHVKSPSRVDRERRSDSRRTSLSQSACHGTTKQKRWRFLPQHAKCALAVTWAARTARRSLARLQLFHSALVNHSRAASHPAIFSPQMPPPRLSPRVRGWTRLQPIRTISRLDLDFAVFTQDAFQFQAIHWSRRALPVQTGTSTTITTERRPERLDCSTSTRPAGS
jgi:hypothetical protein